MFNTSLVLQHRPRLVKPQRNFLAAAKRRAQKSAPILFKDSTPFLVVDY